LAQQLLAKILEAVVVVDSKLRVVAEGEDSAFRNVFLEIVSEPVGVDISARPGSVRVAVKSGDSNDAVVLLAGVSETWKPLKYKLCKSLGH